MEERLRGRRGLRICLDAGTGFGRQPCNVQLPQQGVQIGIAQAAIPDEEERAARRVNRWHQPVQSIGRVALGDAENARRFPTDHRLPYVEMEERVLLDWEGADRPPHGASHVVQPALRWDWW